MFGKEKFMVKFRDGVAELLVKGRLNCHGGEAGREHRGEIGSRVLQSLRKIAVSKFNFLPSLFCSAELKMLLPARTTAIGLLQMCSGSFLKPRTPTEKMSPFCMGYIRPSSCILDFPLTSTSLHVHTPSL
jgi:hypothetical protein